MERTKEITKLLRNPLIIEWLAGASGLHLGEVNLLSKAFLGLEEREKNIIAMRYGFADGFDDTPKTLKRVGQQFGISATRVRQIEFIAFNKIKHFILNGSFPIKFSTKPKKPSVPLTLKNTRVDCLPFSTRTKGVLLENSVCTIGGLMRKKENDILMMTGIGKRSLEDIKRYLADNNLILEK